MRSPTAKHLIRALAAALLLLTAPVASARPAANLAARSVSAPVSTTAGATVDVEVDVSRSGTTGAAAIALYLSADATRDPHDVRLARADKIARGGPSRSIRVAAQPQIPAGQPLGAYRIVACVDDPGRVRERDERDNCRATRAPLRVTAEPVTTRDLVATAVAAGHLSPQQGLVYRVFAAFGDRRLPAAYAGDTDEPDDGVMRAVIAAWPTLSPAQRTELQPHFTPPAAKVTAHSRVAAVDAPRPVCASASLDHDWRSIAREGGHVRVWWKPEEEKKVGPRARSLVTEIENQMWPKLKAIMAREPLRDGGEQCFHGIDDKLDIYMTHVPGARAITVNYPPDCSAAPAFILFDPGASARPQIRRWYVAHELMHAFQLAYRTAAACDSWDNFDEAVATWAGQYVYPGDDDEHRFRFFTLAPGVKLGDASYDGWVFPYAMEKLHGIGTIRSIYEQGERVDVLHAIDAGVPGGLARAWPEFATLAWNQDPLSPTFRQWDRFDQVPFDADEPVKAEAIDTTASGKANITIDLDPVRPLTRMYRHFKLDKSVTQISVTNPSYRGLNVQALIHSRNGTTRTEDWTGRQPLFCPRAAGDQPDDVVLVITNTSLTDSLPKGGKLWLQFTGAGCQRYTGTASGSRTYRSQVDNFDESWTATGLTYERPADGSGGAASDNGAQQARLVLTGGTVTWHLTGTQDGCTVAADATIDLTPERYNGDLFLAFAGNPDGANGYRASASSSLPVPGTLTCKNGTSARNFSPKGPFLSTYVGAVFRPFPADAILQGTETHGEGTGYEATYNWRLVPDGVLGPVGP